MHIVLRARRRRQHGIAGLDDVAAAELERVDAEPSGQFVERRLDGEDHLAQAVAAERARRHVVGVDGAGVHLLVRALVDAEGLAAAVEHHRAGVVAVGAGVGEHVELQRGQPAVRRRRRP